MTLDIVDELGHAIDDRSMQFVLNHLQFTVPKHYFDEALSGSKPNDDDIVEFM
ncbi:putative hydrolase [compost metagenome]